MKTKVWLLILVSVLVACTRPTRGLTETTAPAIATANPESATVAPTESSPTVTPEVALPNSLVPPGEIKVVTLTSNNTERSYWLYLPTTYSPETPVPLIISFHGFGSDAPGQQALSGLSFLAETGNFIVAYPNGLNNEWLDGPKSRDITFTRDLITQLETDYAIDAKRIFVTGMSNGGGMTNRVGCDMADVVAAIAPVAGAYNAWELCDPSRPLPVLAFHGLADNVVPFEGAGQEHMLPPIRDWAAAWAGRNGCAADPAVETPGNGLTIETWGSCEAEVILYSIPNFGHSWPGTPLRPLQVTQTVNASQLMWEFFQAHPLP